MSGQAEKLKKMTDTGNKFKIFLLQIYSSDAEYIRTNFGTFTDRVICLTGVWEPLTEESESTTFPFLHLHEH